MTPERDVVVYLCGAGSPPAQLPPVVVELESPIVPANVWFGTEPMRRRLGRATGPLDFEDLGILQSAPIRVWLEMLVDAGYVAGNFMGSHPQFRLTEEGYASLQWAGSPKPPRSTETVHAADMALGISTLYLVDHHSMLTSDAPGQHLVARGRLCAALVARGWGHERIERHFGMPKGAAKKGCERWSKEARARR